MTECPGCGGPLADDESACPACGLSVGEPTPEEGPEPISEEQEAEAVPAVSPQADGDEPGKLCPVCGTLNPMEAQFCVQCRHPFNGRATIFGMSWLVIPALIGVFLVVAAAAAFSSGLIGGGGVDNTSTEKAAQTGAAGAAQQALNQTLNATPRNVTTPEVVGARNATATPTATPTTTPTRTVDPNATPWNAAEGSGIYHTEGGTHNVEVSREILAHRPTSTPLPYSAGDGSGHATGPLAWVGTGNWSPGFIDLPGGDAQVVLLSQGTTAFILADPAGNHVGFGGFLPPGGTYTVPVTQAGRYVIAFGTANATDSWSATVLLPGSGGGQAAAPPVATPATQILSFAGTGGGSPGSFNLSPGTVHVALTADQMTMAYIKDPWGVTLSTTVAGPYPGGSTVAIQQAGTYHLEVWGTGTWTATVTWTGTPGTGGPTLPTVQPITTVPVTYVTAATTVPPAITLSTTAPTVAQQPLSWSGTGTQSTPPFDLQTGVYRIFVETEAWANIDLHDSLGKHIRGELTFGRGGNVGCWHR